MPIPRLDLKTSIKTLKEMVLLDPPAMITVDCAKTMIAIWPNELLPTWIDALAGVNPELLANGIDEVKRYIIAEAIQAEEKERSRDYHEIPY
jgi:hypothetical protein